MSEFRGVDFQGIRPIVGVPLERAVSYARVVVPWMIALAQQGWPFIQVDPNRTEVTRNLMAEHLLTSDYTHLVMLDVDHDHRADVILRLCTAAAEGRDVVTALSFRRGQPYEPCAFRRGDDGLFHAMLDWEPGAVIEVHRIGLGAVIISRDVFQRIPWPWFKYTYPERGHYPTEDMWFSEQCEEYGVKMFCDTRISNDHLDISRIDETVYRTWLEMEAKGQISGG